MKKTLLYIASALILCSCSEIIVPEGPMTSVKIDTDTEINQIEIESTMKLTLSDQIEEGEIKITTAENIHEHIDVEIEDNKIDIKLDGNSYKELDIEIIASATQFNNIEASGASVVTVEGEGLTFTKYQISLSGTSKFLVNNNLYATKCYITASGASKISGTYFETNELNISLSGASYAKMKVNNSIVGKLSGASTLSYWGKPTVDVEKTGSSKTEKL